VADTLTGITDLATWPPFRRRVRAAMLVAAVAVGNERPVDGDPRSTLRRALSVNAFAYTDDYEGRFAAAVAANPVITGDSSDGDIEFTVNSVWDAIAGAPPATP
jgi:hypothetical protein